MTRTSQLKRRYAHGDFKQLPPATSRAPFIVHPRVTAEFEFRCLRENRRVVSDESRRDELDQFHKVLTDISLGQDSNDVRTFVIDAYIRGFKVGCAENVGFEGSTAVFTRRRYRDKWNRTVVRRVAKKHNHSTDAARAQIASRFESVLSLFCGIPEVFFFAATLIILSQISCRCRDCIKIKGKVRARGVRSQQWYSEQKVQYLRKKCRAQNLWNLHLAGDWHPSMEEALPRSSRQHMMRVMLISNIAVDERFANGTQGRLLHWHPGATESKRRALPAYCGELLARFCKETSLSKVEMIPDMDFMDLGARQETLNTRGEPILLQLCVVPAYALTVHKTQALSIKHLVLGSLEGVFALGQVYVLISRVTDPQNFYLLGVPPRDLLEDVASALIEQGISVDEFFDTACKGLFFSWGCTCFF